MMLGMPRLPGTPIMLIFMLVLATGASSRWSGEHILYGAAAPPHIVAFAHGVDQFCVACEIIVKDRPQQIQRLNRAIIDQAVFHGGAVTGGGDHAALAQNL